MGTDSIITWRTAIVPDAGAKLSVADPLSRDNNYNVSSCCCTQSTTVHDSGELFHSAGCSFSVEIGWILCFTKSLWNTTNLLWSQLTNLFPNVHFKSTVVNCSPWCWRAFPFSSSVSVEFGWMVMIHKIFVKHDKSFVKPTDQPLPQYAFQIHNSKLHSLVSFKTWPDWIGPQ